MFVAKSIQSDHKDLIHDVSYDFHGRRMATCSSDQTVKVNQKCILSSIIKYQDSFITTVWTYLLMFKIQNLQ